jgi:endonuclease YncB( thermonuclease family)
VQQILCKKAPLGAFLLLVLWLGAALAAPVHLTEVIDGDTVALADRHLVRLIGINTPELGKGGAPDEPLARAARKRLTDLVNGQAVTLIPGAEAHDRHGRLLAYLILADGRDAQELLLREGLAALVAIPPNVRFLPRYQAAAEQARRAQRGIWAEPYFAAQDAESVNEPGFRAVRGTVTRIQRRRHDTLLHISTRMVLLVPHADAAQFGCPLASLRGRRVEASGWVSMRKDTGRMRVQHPAMLRLLDRGAGRPANLALACAA